MAHRSPTDDGNVRTDVYEASVDYRVLRAAAHAETAAIQDLIASPGKAGVASAITVGLEEGFVVRERDRYRLLPVLKSPLHRHDSTHHPGCCEAAADHTVSITTVACSDTREARLGKRWFAGRLSDCVTTSWLPAPARRHFVPRRLTISSQLCLIVGVSRER